MIAADSPVNSARTGRRQPSDIPVVDYDPFSAEFFEDPHPVHEKLREAGPVVWLSRYSVYAVARYAEVKAVLDDPTTFCSSRGVGLSDFGRETPWRPKSLILEADPPEHTRVRTALNRVLSLGVTRKLQSAFQAAADALVDELITRGRFDGIRDLAEAFPMSVFPDALGIKEEGREHLLPYASFIFNSLGPDNQLRRDTIAESLPHQAYVVEQCRRENLAPGGFGACVHDRVDAGEITAEEAPLLVRALLTAGVDTTISGIGPHFIVWRVTRSNWRGFVPRLGSHVTRSRKPYASKVPSKPFFGRRHGWRACLERRSKKVRRCLCFSALPIVIRGVG
jgi:cytochrome P450